MTHLSLLRDPHFDLDPRSPLTALDRTIDVHRISPPEIRSAKDKEALTTVHKAGAVEFFTLQEEERR